MLKALFMEKGNFLLDASDSKHWQTRFLIELDLPSREIHNTPQEKREMKCIRQKTKRAVS